MLVIQSYRAENVPEWMAHCLRSVQDWVTGVGAAYHCADDAELLGCLPDFFKEKLSGRWPMLADLGRLKLMQRALEEGCDRVVWLDADVLVVEPERLVLPVEIAYGYAFGRECWVEESGKVCRGVHNALCVFEPGNPFLDYYAHACEQIMLQHTGAQLAPQLLGPKFLKMQHSLLGFELLDAVAMWSPVVVRELIAGGGSLLEKQRAEMGASCGAVNLCHSLLSEEEALEAVRRLLGISSVSINGIRIAE